jgi:hypothetical protein
VAQDPRVSGFGVRRFTGQEFYLFGIATGDFPNQREPSIIGRTRGIRSRISGFGVSGFSIQRNFVSWIRDPRNPERTWQGGSPRQSGRQVSREDRWCAGGIGVSGFGVLCGMSVRHREPRFRYPDIRRGLTVDHRGSGFLVA